MSLEERRSRTKMTINRRSGGRTPARAGARFGKTVASDVSRPAPMVNWAPLRDWAACCALLANGSACTLLGDEFEPLLVPAVDAGTLERANVVTAEPAGDVAPLGCAADDVDGTSV